MKKINARAKDLEAGDLWAFHHDTPDTGEVYYLYDGITDHDIESLEDPTITYTYHESSKTIPVGTSGSDSLITIWRKSATNVTVAQIREYIERNAIGLPAYLEKEDLLNFIDNGPPKPTAEEIIYEGLQQAGLAASGTTLAHEIKQALQQAGKLNEDDK